MDHIKRKATQPLHTYYSHVTVHRNRFIFK